MPQAYDVNWGVDPANSWSDKVGGQLRAALQARQAKQLQEAAQARAAEQEQYKRQQDAVENERKAQADKWTEERMKLDHQKLGLEIKEHKFKTATEEAKLRLGAAAETPQPGFEATQGAEVAPDKAPMMTPDTPEERGAFAASAPPEQIQIPADVTPSGSAINLPVQYKEQADAVSQADAEQKGLSSGQLVRDAQGNVVPASVVNARENAAQRADTAQQHNETVRAIAGMNGGSQGTPIDNPLAQSIANYTADITKVASIRGNQRQRLMAQVLELNPNFDMTQYGARQALRQKYTSGVGATGVTALNTVEKHIRNLEGAYTKMNPGQFPLANWVAQGMQTAGGKAATKGFDTAAEAVASEATRAFRALGGSEEDVKAWRAKLKPNMSPDQFKESVGELRGLLQSRREEITHELIRGGLKPNELAPTAEGLTPGPSEPGAKPASVSGFVIEKVE